MAYLNHYGLQQSAYLSAGLQQYRTPVRPQIGDALRRARLEAVNGDQVSLYNALVIKMGRDAHIPMGHHEIARMGLGGGFLSVAE